MLEGHEFAIFFRAARYASNDAKSVILPMKTLRPSLPTRVATGAYRVIYLASRPEAVYVLHCFQKKTQKTSDPDIALARKRLKAITTLRGKSS
jgi:phage-related protein